MASANTQTKQNNVHFLFEHLQHNYIFKILQYAILDSVIQINVDVLRMKT